MVNGWIGWRGIRCWLGITAIPQASLWWFLSLYNFLALEIVPFQDREIVW